VEKVVYVLWRRQDQDSASLRAYLCGDVAARLVDLGARGIQVNVSDDAVAAADGLRQRSTRPQMDAVLSAWVDTAIARYRRPFDDVVEASVGRMAAYLVTESQPLRNTLHPPVPGQRTTGFSQLAFLKRPPRLTHEAWLDVWHNSHTQVAVETQSSFFYVQNVVVRPLSHAAPALDAMVEECFPSEAMSDPHVFFDAAGDDQKLHRNRAAMMESCRRFIDFDDVRKHFVIDVVPTSQYVVEPPSG